MEPAVLFVTIALFTTTLSSPIPRQNGENNPQINLQDDIILTPEDQIQDIEELSLENAAEKLNPEEFDLIPSEEGETMHTAENLVFRPLFSYRKIQEKRKRLYGTRKQSTTSRPNSLRRSQIVYYSQPQPTRYVYPYQSYQNYQNYQNYPGSYYGNRVYYYPSTK